MGAQHINISAQKESEDLLLVKILNKDLNRTVYVLLI